MKTPILAFKVIVFLLYLINANKLFSQNKTQSVATNVYEEMFRKPVKPEFSDSLFERFIWHKKVSHLVIETVRDGFYVTLLVIPETPYNFKAKTYPLHYQFESYNEAFRKFIWMDKFLKNEGILKVKIAGSKILEETILSSGSSSN